MLMKITTMGNVSEFQNLIDRILFSETQNKVSANDPNFNMVTEVLVRFLRQTMHQQGLPTYSQEHIKLTAQWLCEMARQAQNYTPTFGDVQSSLKKMNAVIQKHQRITGSLKTPEYLYITRQTHDFIASHTHALKAAHLPLHRDSPTPYIIKQAYIIMHRQLGIDGQRGIMRELLPLIGVYEASDKYISKILTPAFRQQAQEHNRQQREIIKQQASVNPTTAPPIEKSPTHQSKGDILQAIKKQLEALSTIDPEMSGALHYRFDEVLQEFSDDEDFLSDQTETDFTD